MNGNAESIPVVYDGGGVVSRQTTWGDMTVSFERATTGADSRMVFQGMPDNNCQCPHWGYVISGRMRVIYADHDEVIEAGEAYYLAPGHTIVCEETGEIVEFSPHDAHQQTMQAVAANIAAKQG